MNQNLNFLKNKNRFMGIILFITGIISMIILLSVKRVAGIYGYYVFGFSGGLILCGILAFVYSFSKNFKNEFNSQNDERGKLIRLKTEQISFRVTLLIIFILTILSNFVKMETSKILFFLLLVSIIVQSVSRIIIANQYRE